MAGMDPGPFPMPGSDPFYDAQLAGGYSSQEAQYAASQFPTSNNPQIRISAILPTTTGDAPVTQIPNPLGSGDPSDTSPASSAAYPRARQGAPSGLDREALTTQSVSNPPPPNAFRDLSLGPNTQINIQPNQQAPVDGSDAYLRGLSPFVIQVELPMAFGQDGGFTNQASNNVSINTYANANGVSDLYANARSSVAASGIGSLALNNMGLPSNPNPTVEGSNKAPDGSLTSSTGVGSSRLGFPAIADQNVAMDIANQLVTVLNIPPLVLLINPQQLQMSLTKVQSYQDRTRYGYIFHTWGEEQPKLSVTTKCGAFMSAGRGVQFASRQDSAAWQNMMNLFRFYKNNGYIHDTIGKSNAHHFVGALSISYDGWIYYGHFESFSYNIEETTQNGGIDFSLEFTVSSAVDTSRPVFAVLPMLSPIQSLSDPRYYGAANVGNEGPGVYTVGKASVSSESPTVNPNPRNTPVSPVASSLVPVGASQILSQPVGFGGFQQVDGVDGRTIQQSGTGTTTLFQVG